MTETQLEIEELINLAYQKGHAEGIIDSLSIETETPEPRCELDKRARLTLEVIESDLSKARLAGYFI